MYHHLQYSQFEIRHPTLDHLRYCRKRISLSSVMSGQSVRLPTAFCCTVENLCITSQGRCYLICLVLQAFRRLGDHQKGPGPQDCCCFAGAIHTYTVHGGSGSNSSTAPNNFFPSYTQNVRLAILILTASSLRMTCLPARNGISSVASLCCGLTTAQLARMRQVSTRVQGMLFQRPCIAFSTGNNGR